MNVLISGSEGYIGAVLRDTLLERGHCATGLDSGYFADCDFHRKPTPIPLIRRDIREVERADVDGFDAVVHLAALSNDPLGALDPDLTRDINAIGSLRLAEVAKAAGVQRFVFSSSCSMYGQGEQSGLNESAPFNPQTAYARSKVEVEQGLWDLADDSFSPTSLRNATAFGLSPRLRFDLVVNNLVGWAWTARAIRLTSDGSPWRPLVHVRDICKAFVCALEAPRESVHKQAFNVGSNENNYQIVTIARRVAEHFPGCEIELGSSDGDSRTYNVDFTKIRTHLPGFDANMCGLDDAIVEMKRACEDLQLDDSRFQGRLYTRLKQIRYLQEDGQLDEQLYWKMN